MGNHTEGNWKPVNTNTGVLVITGEKVICSLNYRLEEYESNAKLIAAAPKMLKALKEIVDKIPPELNYTEFYNIKKVANEAIKKATQ